MKVLILSSPLDWQAVQVEQHLRDLGANVDYFSFTDMIEKSKISFRLGCTKVQASIEPPDGKTLRLEEYTAIWHRRPGHPRSSGLPERWMDLLVEQEARSTAEGMFHPLRCIWVNHPNSDAITLNKLWQLNRAESVGLTIPKTLVTNQEQLVRQFYDECKGRVIYKMIAEASNIVVPAFEVPGGITTSSLREADVEFLDQVRFSPHLFQEKISKKYDLRVTIVGHKIYCIRIDSQSGRGKLDWRLDYSVNMEPTDLPPEIATRSLELMRKLGLNYGALDFCVDEDGRYMFFEINCAGQYGWIEQRCKLPISMEVAKLLAGMNEPLVHTTT